MMSQGILILNKGPRVCKGIIFFFYVKGIIFWLHNIFGKSRTFIKTTHDAFRHFLTTLSVVGDLANWIQTSNLMDRSFWMKKKKKAKKFPASINLLGLMAREIFWRIEAWTGSGRCRRAAPRSTCIGNEFRQKIGPLDLWARMAKAILFWVLTGDFI